MMITQIYVTWNHFCNCAPWCFSAYSTSHPLAKGPRFVGCSALLRKLWQFFFLLLTQKVNVPVSYASLERGITVTHI